MGPDETRLRRLLRRSGLSGPAIDAAWPDWWTDDASASPSARVELRFALARSLGLDPRPLVDGDRVVPAFAGGPRYKSLTAERAMEHSTVASFGKSVARLLFTANPSERRPPRATAAEVRGLLLRNRRTPDYPTLVALCWQLGMPVICLQVVPLEKKAMHAMAVAGGSGRGAILLARDTGLYARAAFTLAHEIGHVLLGHLTAEPAHLDFDDPLSAAEADDDEDAANRFALELLTGRPEPVITTSDTAYNSAQLAHAAGVVGRDEGIDPGVIAMCDGFRTGDWRRATRAAQRLQPAPAPIPQQTNEHAAEHLDWTLLSEEGEAYLRRVMGLADG